MAEHKGARSKGPTAPKRPPLTHFLCIPLVTPNSRTQLEKSIARFRDETTSCTPKMDREIEGAVVEAKGEVIVPTIPVKGIRPVGSLHCTLGVMSLDEERLTKAVECLHGGEVRGLIDDLCSASNKDSEATSGEAISMLPITISMKGLASMHSPRQTSILYCPPDDASGRLYPLCVALQKLFKDKGLVIEDNRPLKLHATIVNTIYSKGPRSAGHGPNAKAPVKIDATSLLVKYEDFVWADNLVLDRIAICEMGAKKVYNAQGDEVGAAYTEVATLSLPT